MILSVLVAAALLGLAYRLVARARSYALPRVDGVHVRNFPRREFVVELEDVERFDTDGTGVGTGNLLLLLRHGKVIRLMASPRSRAVAAAVEMNNTLAEIRTGRQRGKLTNDQAAFAGGDFAGTDNAASGHGAAVLAHLGLFILGIVVPLIVMAGEGARNAWVRRHAVQALNLQLTVFIVWVPLVALLFTSEAFGVFPSWPVISLMALVFGFAAFSSVAAAAKAAQGQEVRHRLALPFVDASRGSRRLP